MSREMTDAVSVPLLYEDGREKDGNDLATNLSRPAKRAHTAASMIIWALLLVAALGAAAFYGISIYSNRGPSTDVVIAYYNRSFVDMNHMNDVIANAESIKARRKSPLFLVYTKHSSEPEHLKEVMEQPRISRVTPLANFGRELHTILHHIVHSYDRLADHTMFCQEHLGDSVFPDLFEERLAMLQDNTGYLQLTTYARLDRTYDMDADLNFPLISELYSMFWDTLMPTGEVTAGNSAFMIVSRKRIRQHSLLKWRNLLALFELPEDAWIFDPKTHLSPVTNWHGPVSKVNPAFGHGMERAWPIIFGCDNPQISDECGWFAHNGTSPSISTCQCFD